MSWIEFFIRVYGWLLALGLFLGFRAIWHRYTEKRDK